MHVPSRMLKSRVCPSQLSNVQVVPGRSEFVDINNNQKTKTGTRNDLCICVKEKLQGCARQSEDTTEIRRVTERVLSNWCSCKLLGPMETPGRPKETNGDA